MRFGKTTDIYDSKDRQESLGLFLDLGEFLGKYHLLQLFKWTLPVSTHLENLRKKFKKMLKSLLVINIFRHIIYTTNLKTCLVTVQLVSIQKHYFESNVGNFW